MSKDAAARVPTLIGMIVDGYVRVSQVGGRSGERFISPLVQREHIERCAKLQGASVAHVFEEFDESGGRRDRPLLMQAIARVERGESDGLVVAYASRFARSQIDGLLAIDRITKAGGVFVSASEGLGYASDIGRHMLRTMLSWAEWELDRTRSNWEVARARAVARGVSIGPRPLGYRRCLPCGTEQRHGIRLMAVSAMPRTPDLDVVRAPARGSTRPSATDARVSTHALSLAAPRYECSHARTMGSSAAYAATWSEPR